MPLLTPPPRFPAPPVRLDIILNNEIRTLFSNPLIFIPITIGFVFHRKFILIANFVILLLSLTYSLFSYPSILVYTSTVNYLTDIPTFFIPIIFNISINAVFSYMISDIVRRLSVFYKIQEILNRVSKFLQFFAFIAYYFAIFAAIVIINDIRTDLSQVLYIINNLKNPYYVGKNLTDYFQEFSLYGLIMITAIIFLVVIYKKAFSFPEKKLSFDGKDKIYLYIYMLIIIVSYYVARFFYA